MKDLIEKIKVWFAMRKADKELDEAIHKAWELCERNDRRYYVLPDTGHHLTVLSWSDIKMLMHQGVFNRFVKESDFIKECFYFTPKKVTDPVISPEAETRKRKEWRRYYRAYRI